MSQPKSNTTLQTRLQRDLKPDVTPKPPRQVEVYKVTCWQCGRTVELATSKRPYHCLHCGALLLIQWRSVR